MKSLLVDAMRQAKGDKPGVTLSDSGSYDTTSAELLDTANDADALSLFETSAGIEVGNPTPPVADAENNDPPPQYVATGIATVASRAPALARWTPVLCIVLAVVSAAGWSLYQQFQLRYGKSTLSAQVELMPALSAGLASSEGDAEAVTRFPFIAVESSLTSEESSQ